MVVSSFETTELEHQRHSSPLFMSLLSSSQFPENEKEEFTGLGKDVEEVAGSLLDKGGWLKT